MGGVFTQPGSDSEVERRNRDFRSSPNSRHPASGCDVRKVPNSDMTLIRRPQKKKPPRRRLFNTGRCGVGQRLSHVYSRPTQPLQDSQRDRRNERPDHITEFVCEDCGDDAHVFGHYYGLPVHSTCPLHPRTSDMPEHIIKGHLRGDT